MSYRTNVRYPKIDFSLPLADSNDKKNKNCQEYSRNLNNEIPTGVYAELDEVWE